MEENKSDQQLAMHALTTEIYTEEMYVALTTRLAERKQTHSYTADHQMFGGRIVPRTTADQIIFDLENAVAKWNGNTLE